MHRYYGAAVRPVCVAGGETPSSVSRTMPDAAGLLQASPVIGDVAWSETRTVTDGVQLTQMVATLSSGFPETLHLLTVDLEADGIHMRVALPDNAKETPAGEWPRQTLSAMASGLTSETDQVVAMVNSSFWNTTTFTRSSSFMPRYIITGPMSVRKPSMNSIGSMTNIVIAESV